MNGIASNPQDAALAEAVKIMGDIMKNEETRFSNLNTRAVAVVSATSLVTALMGVFSKDLIGKDFTGWGRRAGAYGAMSAVALLALTAGIVVIGVLAPKARLLFGGNALVDAPATVADANEVDRVAFRDYLDIYTNLSIRNKEKAQNLNAAYYSFFGAVLVIASTTILVLLSRI